ncbi:hypothetical protein TVAG_028450 [Trichomonas vaginalis G3]|uniref:Uncharacterized protein n=1 Tax=Trichomonas vaginalis (strain ATCC PRA-98 / G3) TaxID=412133 RepID=A2E092_TRIV3|nr:hypothetical protein TVAGG3_0557000 [Trichomonas vaginalis G3]EAY13892.1 hypothetical protein TVAG_028450 [Trichomonas vaginalis G3]KAI5520924.1 hypothetical protein TVAGG3_0557000 [Trichomonas vaginalis G3]|eukprot:XP_001326115.1 hypothetical protein [Trichomonas vaginalis G3]
MEEPANSPLDNQDKDDSPIVNTIMDTDKFDVLEYHRRNELFESRITDGKIPNDPHPYDASIFAENDFIGKNHRRIKMDPDEIDRYEGYSKPVSSIVVPNFWPSRSWDKPEYLLSAQKSLELQEKIKELNKIAKKDEYDYGNYSTLAEPLCPDNSADNEDLKDHILTFSMLDHGTDDSTDTDII